MVCFSVALVVGSIVGPTPIPGEVREYRSSNGAFEFHVVTGKKTNGVWKGKGVLYRKGAGGEKIGEWDLVNLPGPTYVADDGKHVVTIDTLLMGAPDHAFVVYDCSGTVELDLDLNQLDPGKVGIGWGVHFFFGKGLFRKQQPIHN